MFFAGERVESKAAQTDVALEGEIALLFEAACLVEAAVQMDSADSLLCVEPRPGATFNTVSDGVFSAPEPVVGHSGPLAEVIDCNLV